MQIIDSRTLHHPVYPTCHELQWTKSRMFIEDFFCRRKEPQEGAAWLDNAPRVWLFWQVNPAHQIVSLTPLINFPMDKTKLNLTIEDTLCGSRTLLIRHPRTGVDGLLDVAMVSRALNIWDSLKREEAGNSSFLDLRLRLPNSRNEN